MRDSVLPHPAPRKPDNARDPQAELYREIGISAVAAALRFTTQPEPARWAADAGSPRSSPRREGIAA